MSPIADIDTDTTTDTTAAVFSRAGMPLLHLLFTEHVAVFRRAGMPPSSRPTPLKMKKIFYVFIMCFRAF